MAITAEMLVFSGNADPTFTLDDAQTGQLSALVAQNVGGIATPAQQEEPSILGYRGFRLSGATTELGGFSGITITGGTVIAVSPDGLSSFPDAAGCEQQLLADARQHGLGDLLDELGLGGNV